LSANKARLAGFALIALFAGRPRVGDMPLLERMGLAHPRGLAGRLLRRVLARALHDD
jgi:hypothetical protein